MKIAARIVVLLVGLICLFPLDASAWPRPARAKPLHERPSAECRAHRPGHPSANAHRPPSPPWLWHRHAVSPDTIHVHDGDTFYTGPETIRLRGIDTPELGQPRALAAKIRLIALLHEGAVTIVPRAEDVYGRTVADVYVRGRNIADVLRSEGFEKPRDH